MATNDKAIGLEGLTTLWTRTKEMVTDKVAEVPVIESGEKNISLVSEKPELFDMAYDAQFYDADGNQVSLLDTHSGSQSSLPWSDIYFGERIDYIQDYTLADGHHYKYTFAQPISSYEDIKVLVLTDYTNTQIVHESVSIIGDVGSTVVDFNAAGTIVQGTLTIAEKTDNSVALVFNGSTSTPGQLAMSYPKVYRKISTGDSVKYLDAEMNGLAADLMTQVHAGLDMYVQTYSNTDYERELWGSAAVVVTEISDGTTPSEVTLTGVYPKGTMYGLFYGSSVHNDIYYGFQAMCPDTFKFSITYALTGNVSEMTGMYISNYYRFFDDGYDSIDTILAQVQSSMINESNIGNSILTGFTMSGDYRINATLDSINGNTIVISCIATKIVDNPISESQTFMVSFPYGNPVVDEKPYIGLKSASGCFPIGDCSFATGYANRAIGYCSNAAGINTVAKGHYSHAEGEYTVALGNSQHVFGRYNDADETSVEIVGWGDDERYRSNIRRLDRQGNQFIAGKLFINGNNSIPGSVTYVVPDDGTIEQIRSAVSYGYTCAIYKNGKFSYLSTIDDDGAVFVCNEPVDSYTKLKITITQVLYNNSRSSTVKYVALSNS